MRLPLLTLAATLVAAPPVTAQAVWSVQGGLGWSSTLVEDDIGGPITLTPGLAPTLILGAAVPAFPKNRLGLEVAIGRPGLEVEDETGSYDFMTVTTVTATLGMDGNIAEGVRWRAGVGAISYLPSEDEGIFVDGGHTTWLVGAGVDYRRPISGSLDLIASGRYDYHRFTTDALERAGFAHPETVNRVTLGLGVGGRF